MRSPWETRRAQLTDIGAEPADCARTLVHLNPPKRRGALTKLNTQAFTVCVHLTTLKEQIRRNRATNNTGWLYHNRYRKKSLRLWSYAKLNKTRNKWASNISLKAIRFPPSRIMENMCLKIWFLPPTTDPFSAEITDTQPKLAVASAFKRISITSFWISE